MIDNALVISAVIAATLPIKLMLFRPTFVMAGLPYLGQTIVEFRANLIANYGEDVFTCTWTRVTRTILLFLTLLIWVEASSETYLDAWQRIVIFAFLHIAVSWLFLTTRTEIRTRKNKAKKLVENEYSNWMFPAMMLVFLPTCFIYFLGDSFENQEMRYLENLSKTEFLESQGQYLIAPQLVGRVGGNCDPAIGEQDNQVRFKVFFNQDSKMLPYLPCDHAVSELLLSYSDTGRSPPIDRRNAIVLDLSKEKSQVKLLSSLVRNR